MVTLIKSYLLLIFWALFITFLFGKNVNSETLGKPYEPFILNQLNQNPSLWDDLNFSLYERRLAYDNSTNELVLLNFDIPKIAFTPHLIDDNSDDTIKLFSSINGKQPRLKPFLKSGGPLLKILHPLTSGHYEVTFNVLKEKGRKWEFAKSAARIMADASRDPDLFEWTSPEAHAQTDLLENGITPGNPEKSKNLFFNWIQNRLREVKVACKEHNYSLALYQLGRALHGIQDLPAHNGMTNAEHSFLNHVGMDPDMVERNIDLAKSFSREFLYKIVIPFIGQCYNQIRHLNDVNLEPWSVKKVQKELGMKVTLTPREYFLFLGQGKKLRNKLGRNLLDTKQGRSLQVRWFDLSNPNKVINDLKIGIVQRVN